MLPGGGDVTLVPLATKPRGHAAHASALLAPGGPYSVAFWQSLQADAPGSGLYVPTGQGSQSPTDEEPFPAANVPAGQGVHTVAPLVSTKVPAGHGAQPWSSEGRPPARPYLPAGQAGHVDLDASPSAPYVPSGHGRQAAGPDAPATSLKFPAPHSTHAASDTAPSSGPYVPAGHTRHSARSDMPSWGLYVPRGHGVHAAWPSTSVYVPGGHDMQLSPAAGAYVPTGQLWQASNNVAVVLSHSVPGGQGEHASIEAAPVPFVTRPVGQESHTAVPFVTLYFPVGHGSHGLSRPSSLEAVPGPHGRQARLEGAPRCPENVPAGQLAHAASSLVRFSPSPCVPSGHREQLKAPGPENDPLGHGTQYVALGAPGASEYVPARHSSHASSSEPSFGPVPNLPGEQAVHDDELLDAKVPLGQGTHASGDDPPGTGLYVPLEHNVQTDAEVAPTAVEYEPTGHCRHCPTPRPAPLSPAGRKVPSGHGRHVSMPSGRTAVPKSAAYVPALQPVPSARPKLQRGRRGGVNP